MIRPEDADFHDPTEDDPTWGETNYFGFYVPEIRLNCGLYALFRNQLGVVNTTVSMNSRRVTVPWEAEYWDSQVHVPFPEGRNLRDYRLANGLQVRSPEPNRVWHVRFDDGEDTRIEFVYTALMEAFDIHDPDQDPMVAAAAEGSDFAWGTAYNGHFDQTGHYEGEVTLRGRTYPFECVSTMDHSWGPRPERGAPSMSWLHAHFSRDFFMHGIFSFDPTDGPGGESALSLAHGYLVDGGQLYGLKAGSGVTARKGCYPQTTELEVTDRRDRTWRLSATAQTTFPWQCWPDMVGFNVLHEWRCEGHEGLGEAMDFYAMPQANRLYNR